MSEPEKFYGQILADSKAALAQFDTKVGPMTSTPEAAPVPAKVQRALAAMVRSGTPEDAKRLHDFVDLLFQLRKVVKETHKKFSGDLNELEREERNASYRREKEQTAEWSKYGHRMARWALSAVAILVLYSVAVNLSIGVLKDTLHVPVHDWVTELSKK